MGTKTVDYKQQKSPCMIADEDDDLSAEEICSGMNTIFVEETEEMATRPDGKFMPIPPLKVIAQIALVGFVGIALLYFARVVILPLVLALVGGMALKPVIRWLSRGHIPSALSAAIVLAAFIGLGTLAFLRLGQPAIAWVNDAPNHMTQLRERIQKIFRPATRISQVAAAVSNLATTGEEQKKATPVEVRDGHETSALVNWTGGLLAGMGETLVLLYLLLASGDTFLQKLVRIMPSLHDKRRAVELSHEIQQNISTYLLSVSLINLGFGVAISAGLYFLGVPNAAMWGMIAGLLNYIPYFGPILGIILLGIVGLLTFTNFPNELFPALWYLSLHLIEANFVTPILLGRRFTLNPVVIFVSLMFWTWLWGIPGALLSVPILISLKAVCDRVPSLSPVSEFLVS